MITKFSKNTDKRLKEIVTGDETWAFYYDPLTRMQSMEWVRPNEPRPEKLRRGRSVKKHMLIIFFDCSGIVSKSKLVQQPNQRSVNASFYVKKCLTPLLSALKKKYPKSGNQRILLHHDNAPAHTAAFTKSFLKKKKFSLLSHPPYSPDLAPCDFHLFPKLKEKLRGRKYSTERQLDFAIHKILKELSKNGFLDVFRKWLDRCQKCLNHSGGYFEGLR